MGNIGFKTALMLTEVGGVVKCVSRDYGKTLTACKAIDMVKPRHTLASPVPFRDMMSALSVCKIAIVAANSKKYNQQKTYSVLSKY